MYEPNVRRLLELIKPEDVVLDIGGWASPFNRANYILDAQPFETRGFYRTLGLPASQGGDVEHFTKDRWVVRDICEHTPFPFTDKMFDWVTCSHTLEDVRDPLWVCAEMMRIGKRGYIEVPSRLAESSRGWELPNIAGLSHHRWLIDIDAERSRIEFLMKFHRIHSHWRFSLPRAYRDSLPASAHVQWLFWTDRFDCVERTIHGIAATDVELERYVAATHPYPAWRLRASALSRRAASLLSRVWR